MTVIPSELDIQTAHLRNELSNLHTCMPAEIVAVRDGGADARQFVDVQPMLRRTVANEDGLLVEETLPVIQMVPVAYMQGGGFFISLPLRVGDVVTLVFAERSLDQWIETAQPGHGTAVNPGDLSMHSFEGAIALPCGPAPRAALLQGVDPTDLVVATASGTVLQRWKADGKVVIAEGTEAVALANLVLERLDKIQSTFDAHTHPAVTTATVGASATVGTVTVAAPSSTIGTMDSVAASNTKAG